MRCDMSKNTFGNLFKIIGETIEKIENSELVKDVKKTTSEKVESVEKYLEKEKETLDSNQNEKQMELRRLINAAKENSHENNEDEVNASSSSNHLSDNLKGIYEKVATELSKLSQNKMIALILGLSGSKDQSELSNLSATAIREVLLGLVIYLFKTGKSKFVFVTLASMLGYKVYEYFKTQQDSKKTSVNVAEVEETQVRSHTNSNDNGQMDENDDDFVSVLKDEVVDNNQTNKKERDEILVDALVEEVLRVNKTNGVEKSLDINENTPITKELNKEQVKTIVQKRRNRRKEMQRSAHDSSSQQDNQK